jgi:hypothetical protein
MSTDGGTTWGPRIKINDDVTTNDQWQPTIAVTPDGSKLGIFYYSRQEDLTRRTATRSTTSSSITAASAPFPARR